MFFIQRNIFIYNSNQKEVMLSCLTHQCFSILRTIFHWFSKPFALLARNSPDTSHIYDFYDNFLKNTQYELIDFKTLVKKTDGYMFFHLEKYNNTRKKLDTFKIKDDIYYILGGTYISPFACS